MMGAKTAHRLDTVSAPCGHKKKNTQTQKGTETLKKKKKKNSYAERHSLPELPAGGSEPPMGFGNEQQRGLGLTRRHGDRHDDLITDAKNRLRDMGVIP